jgi:plastocyanin
MRAVLSLVALLALSAQAISQTTHTVVASGFTFSPDSIFIAPGDSVQFSLGSTIHNAAQVDKPVWDANGTTSNGGFMVPFGGGTIGLADTGIYYYVCQNHAPMGMKGIIRVGVLAAPNSITVESMADQDGSLATTGDRMLKNWRLKLYKDSVGSGIVVDSAGSESSITATNLPAGTYVAVEADSLPWSHISVSVDGVSQGPTSLHQWPVTVSSGEDRTIDFINFAPHTIINSGFTFVPDSFTIPAGDTIHFVLEMMHTAREVSQSTWLANDTISNGGFDLPFGGGSAVLNTLGMHYYICIPHAPIGMKGRILVASPGSFFTVHRNVAAGWNMVSLPVDATDRHVTALYPNAVSRAFAYQGSYTPETILSAGAGYWLKFNTGQTVSVTGFPVVRDTIDALKGWNMVGSIAFPRASASVVSNPSGIINSPFFGFSGSYFVADTILPGFGYWVRLSEQGKLIIDTSSAAATPRTLSEGNFLGGASRLVIRDAADHERTLYIVEEGPDTDPPPSFAELPPLPPQGAFDVRFASGQWLKILRAHESGEFPVLLSSVSYPIDLSWAMNSPGRGILLRLDGKSIGLTGTGSIRITAAVGRMSLAVVNAPSLPVEYALSDAYPNPFNPATVIGYSLPAQSRVLVRVYNILGQLITTLVDATEGAGQKFVSWDAGEKASGLYFVRLDATAATGPVRSFTRAIKVVLQK